MWVALRRTAAVQSATGQSVARQNAAVQIAVRLGAVSRNGQGQDRSVPVWDENLPLQGALSVPGVEAGQFQIVSSAEIRGGARTPAVLRRVEPPRVGGSAV